MAIILDGKKVSLVLRESLKKTIQEQNISPHLVVFLTHPHPASTIYVRNKIKACAEVGIQSTLVDHPCSSLEEIIALLAPFSARSDVDGILIQLPLHPAIDPSQVMQFIPPGKDVDGLHPLNLGKLVMGDSSGFIPCTPLGIDTLLSHYEIDTKGRHVVIVGRSITVGKPLALLLSQKGKDATVTLSNRSTPNLESLCKSADILVAAAGQKDLIKGSMIKQGAVVIDVGINRVDNTIVGDVDYASAHPHVSAITPVPGGIGPMTIASLLQNSVKSCLQRIS
jgi:methylenetetrahydrofolate dehydrogenase (NADP+) / methenyltetrahydrofolate cyclohydrolase